MKFLFTILLFVSVLYPQMPAEEWVPNQYKKEAIKYYDALDADQWRDVYWHVKAYGIRQAVFAGMEGSNRPGIKHSSDDHQDVGVSYGTALLYHPPKGLRNLLRLHSFAATLSAEIDAGNLAMELSRGIHRPYLNAAMRYPGGSNWRSRLRYGLAFMARYSELERRLMIRRKHFK